MQPASPIPKPMHWRRVAKPSGKLFVAQGKWFITMSFLDGVQFVEQPR
jgi:hypothetical protein